MATLCYLNRKLIHRAESELRGGGGEFRTTWLLVGRFTGIDPIAVNIHGLGQICYRSLELFQANAAGYNSRVAGPFHFDVTGFLVVTERAGKLGVQVPGHFFLGRRLSL